MPINDYDGNRALSNVTSIAGGDPNTGEMRRRYNFADKFSELAIDQTPFFRMVSKIGKKPTDDPQFKYTEKRQSWMKRYAYCIAAGTDTSANNGVPAGLLDGDLDTGETFLYMATDYLSHGNVQNVIGQTGNLVGGAGTRPEFYLENQERSILVI